MPLNYGCQCHRCRQSKEHCNYVFHTSNYFFLFRKLFTMKKSHYDGLIKVNLQYTKKCIRKSKLTYSRSLLGELISYRICKSIILVPLFRSDLSVLQTFCMEKLIQRPIPQFQVQVNLIRGVFTTFDSLSFSNSFSCSC